MNNIINHILSGSCTPATDLVAAVKAGKVDCREANEAYLGRLQKSTAVRNIFDGAESESSYLRTYDI